MHDEGLDALQVDGIEPLQRPVDVPSHYVPLGGVDALIFSDRCYEIRISNHLVRQTKSPSLTHVGERGRGVVKLC